MKHKKLIITITLITLLLVSLATALTQTQLENWTNEEIKQYIRSEAIGTPIYYDEPSNNYVFSYTSKTIEKIDNEYILKPFIIEAYLDRTLWTQCRGHYTYNQCYQILVNDGTKDYSVRTKLKRILNDEVNKIAKWRDNPTIDEELIGGLLV